MGTRSNIILLTPDYKVIQFYRHWDGYFSETGLDLMSKLNIAYAKLYASKVTGSRDSLTELKELDAKLNLSSFMELPTDISLYSMFLKGMLNDLRIEGDASWNNNHYEIEGSFDLHSDIEWVYFIDFMFDQGKGASLFYKHLGFENEYLDKYSRDIMSMYGYVKVNGHNPITLRETPVK